MIKIISLVAVAGVAGLLMIARTRPGTFRVQRTISIDALDDRIFPLINDLHEFNRWSPYVKKDPNMKGVYRGPASGSGAACDFQGNKEVGKGSFQIVDSSAPGKIGMKLDMIEPFEIHNNVEFSLVRNGNATDVTRAMHGPSPFIARLVGLFMNMDHMVGRDFEAGLISVKTLAERK